MVACLSGGRELKPIVHGSHAAAQCDVHGLLLLFLMADGLRHNRLMTTNQVSPANILGLNIIEWVDEIDSTNSELLRRAATGLTHVPQVLVATRQTQGRGRAGRSWISPGPLQNAENLCLSILMDVAVPLVELPPLTLALGVAARRALPQVQLKWPNDLFLYGKKLGGILVEVAKSSAQGCTVVAGIGINLRMPQTIEIDQQFTDLARHDLYVSAQELAPIVVAHFLDAANDYAHYRLTNFLAEWREADALNGRELIVSDDPTAHWRGVGVSERGGLLVGLDARVRELLVGEVRVRINR